MPYFKIRHNLSVIEEVILMEDRILIPKLLRKEILSRIHVSHMGIQRTQNLAKETVYWPNINTDIFNLVSNCEICLKFQNSQSKYEMMSHDIIDIPWFKLGCNLFEYGGKTYLLIVDYFSKYFEVSLLNTGYSSSQVIVSLKSIFARHGIPQYLISDNGPPFNSKEFKNFCSSWGIIHNTSSPYMPRSNGLAERSIQIMKNILKKSSETNDDPYLSLLHYRTTPKGKLPSPSEVLMSRKLRTNLPILTSKLEPLLINKQEYIRDLNNFTYKSTDRFKKLRRKIKT